MIRAREEALQTDNAERFWGEFEERFGEIGRDPATYYSVEIGHMLRIAPDGMGELTPGQIMDAVWLFDKVYRDG